MTGMAVEPKERGNDRPRVPASANRLRRLAQRQGLALVKPRRHDPRAIDYGTYALVDPTTNVTVAGSRESGYGMSLKEIEVALNM